jgi:hypothetical protein
MFLQICSKICCQVQQTILSKIDDGDTGAECANLVRHSVALWLALPQGKFLENKCTTPLGFVECRCRIP